MTRLTFGVSSLSFIANMAIKQNAVDIAHEYPLAAEAVHYVDIRAGGSGPASQAMAEPLFGQRHE